jgi:hypothetical protein
LRKEAVRPVRAYFTGLVVPFWLMLAVAMVARDVIGDASTGHGIVQQFLVSAGSIVAAAVAGMGYFTWYFRHSLFRYVAMLRDRLVAPA